MFRLLAEMLTGQRGLILPHTSSQITLTIRGIKLGLLCGRPYSFVILFMSSYEACDIQFYVSQ